MHEPPLSDHISALLPRCGRCGVMLPRVEHRPDGQPVFCDACLFAKMREKFGEEMDALKSKQVERPFVASEAFVLCQNCGTNQVRVNPSYNLKDHGPATCEACGWTRFKQEGKNFQQGFQGRGKKV